MADFLDVLARATQKTIEKRYYEVSRKIPSHTISLQKAIRESKHLPIITEIKVASPSRGTIRNNANLAEIAKAMARSGAAGISILTEPKHFHGSLVSLTRVRRTVRLPILMKDIIISPTQLEAAAKIGADAVLLIQTLFDRGYGECDVHEMIDQARFKNLEVLLETHTEQEFQRAIETKAPLIGINNRDLKTLRIDLGVTQRILKKNADHGKIVVSESGIQTPADLRFLWKCGAHAFLIGSAIMLADNIEKKVQEFVLTI